MAKVSPLWKWLTILFIIISIALLIALIVVASKGDKKKEEAAVCASGMDVSVTLSSASGPPHQGLFDDLSALEIKKVRDYMFQVKPLDLKPNQELKINSNRIAIIQLYPPSKDDALAYLDQKKAMKPERQAIVVVFRGASQPAVVEEYIVGPVDAPTKHTLRKVDGREYPINFNARPFSTQEGIVLHNVIFTDVGRKAHDLINESYDGYSYGDNCVEKCLFVQFAAPMGLTSKTRDNWFGFYRHDLPFYIHPLNFEFYVNHAGSDPSKWRVEKVLYNDQLFDSVEELMAAYRNASLIKTFIPALSDEEKKGQTH
ncbi:putative amine oxidase [copper-containing] [Actinia tenebrosa]|uniref:Amine oxidase n=1 Tax=Actinia tenebrosa TaxID=6105 RepID=A0A6P8IRY0_ACTTE|nr:putative amine oxidase [copper-containing] [Actinia tenebrosa]